MCENMFPLEEIVKFHEKLQKVAAGFNDLSTELLQVLLNKCRE
jgi:hypothetical protein